MEIRTVESLAEFRGAMAVNAAAWGDAYADVLPDSVLAKLSVPEEPTLRERYAEATGPDRRFLVAVDDAPSRDDAPSDDCPATAEAGIVGFAEFVWDPAATKSFVGDSVGLRAIYVHPKRQSEGVGSELLAAGIERIPDRERVVLETFAANDDARAFYEARGFQRVDASAYEIAGRSYETVVYARELGDQSSP